MPSTTNAYANSLVVKIDGQLLAPDMRDRLVQGFVDDSVHVPSMFLLRFSDPKNDVLTKIKAAIGKKVTVAVKRSTAAEPVELIDGDITALEQEIDERGSFVTVRGLDLRYKLQSGAQVTAFAQMSVASIVRKVAQDRGLQAQVSIEGGGAQLDHLAKDRESDWDFLCRLARQVGTVMWMEGRKLHFEPPTKARTATSGTNAETDPTVIAGDTNVISLRATLTGAGQVPEVEVRGWDVNQKSEVSNTAQAATTAAAVQATPAQLATKVSGTKHVLSRSDLAPPTRTVAVAKSTAAARSGGFAELEGVVHGNPQLRAGTAVNLVKVAEAFAGKYVLTSVRHDFDPVDGYLTTFAAADVSDRSVYGVMSGAVAAPGGHEPHRGVLTATVTNAKDPDGLGRVKVKLPTLSGDYESWWARALQLGAGANRGVSWLPEVGDEVLLAFGQGTLDEPYVLGGLYNGRDKAHKGWAAHVNSGDGKIKRRAFTSRSGMIIEFLEAADQESLTISTNDGKQHLTLTQKAQAGIVLASEGPIAVTAKDKVTIDAQGDVAVTSQGNIDAKTDSGTFKVKAMNVELEATNAVKVKGVTFAAEGSGSAEVKGANVKVAASAAAELSAGAMTTVRGAMVKIN